MKNETRLFIRWPLVFAKENPAGRNPRGAVGAWH